MTATFSPLKVISRAAPRQIAFCRGFLLTISRDVSQACIFCRAFLVSLYGQA